MKNNFLRIVLCLILISCLPLSLAAQSSNGSENGFRWIKTLSVKDWRPMVNGLAAYMSENNKWGYMNETGNVAIQPVYEDVCDFEDGYARVKKDGKWGIIKSDGNVSVDFAYDDISAFYEGLALAVRGRKASFITADGSRKSFPDKYDYFPFHDGLAKIKLGDEYGYINLKGKVEIAPRFSDASDFSGGYARAIQKKDVVCINKRGRVQHFNRFLQEPLIFKDGLAKIKTIRGYQYVNRKLRTGIPAYKEASDYSEGLAFVSKAKGEKFYINTKGKKVFEVPYERCGDFHEGKAWFCQDGKYGYIDNTGKEIIAPVFSMVTDFGAEVAYVEYQGKKGIVGVGSSTDIYSELLITSVELEDANNNHVVDAGEPFSVKVNVLNSGMSPLEDIRISLICPDELSRTLSLVETVKTIDKLASRENTTLVFEVNALPDFQAENICFVFEATSQNLLSTVSKSFEMKGKGIHCLPLIAEVQVGNSGNTPLTRGLANFLSVKLFNKGQDPAKKIKLNIIWPNKFVFENEQLNVPDLKAGDSAVVKIQFVIDTTLQASEYTLTMSVTEYTGLYKDSRSLTFAVDTVNPIINYLTGDTIAVEPSKTGPTVIHIEEREVEEYNKKADSTEVNKPELSQGLDSINNGKASCKYAMVIGVENYVDGKVDYALSSASTFAEYCDKVLGVPRQQIIYLPDATKEEMVAEFNKLIKLSRSRPNQIELIFYYAGKSRYDKTCLLQSVKSEDVNLNTMYAQLSAVKAKKVSIFIDAAYCGSNQDMGTALKGNLFVMASSANNEMAAAYPEKEQRMFSYFLMKELKSYSGRILVKDLYNKVRKDMQVQQVKQSPELLFGVGATLDLNNWYVY